METQFTKRTYTKSQATLLTKSMLIAGIAFLIIGAASFGFSRVFQNYTAGENITTGLAIFIVSLLAGIIVSLLWSANMMKNGSVGLTILCYAIYILTTSIAFGWLFALGFQNSEAYWLPVMFAVVGGIMLIAAMIARVMSVNGLLTMGKIMAATAIVMGIFFLIFFVLLFVIIFAPSGVGNVLGNAICTGVMMGMSVFAFIYIIADIWMIGKASEFADTTGQEYPAIVTWYFGFKLLTDLVNILFIVLLWILRFGKR